MSHPIAADEAGPSSSSAAAAVPVPSLAGPSSSLRQQHQRGKCFLLLVTGEIEAVELVSVSSVYCKYCFVYGADWRQVGGMEEGITATGHRPAGGQRIVLNTPIEVTFSSTNPFKWPQIVLSFYGQDALGNDVIRGYSATHLPSVPGRTKRRCPLFLPQASTAIQRLLGLFTGRRAEFVDARTVAMAEGRDATRVSTQGFVELSLCAVLRDVKKFGYDVCPQTVMKFSEFPLGWPPAIDQPGAGPILKSPSQGQGVEARRGPRGQQPRPIETIQELEEEQHQPTQSLGAHQQIVEVETVVEEAEQNSS